MSNAAQRLYNHALRDGETRVLYLGVQDDTIICRMTDVELTNAKYIALSWCWSDGDQTPNSLLVNNVEVAVTTGVVSMLRQVHDLAHILNPEGLPYWLDTICINQTGTDEASKREKAAQIKVQDKIYGCAQRVIVWLGVAADDSQLFKWLLQYLGCSLAQPVSTLASQHDLATIRQHILAAGIESESLDSIVRILADASAFSDAKALIPQGLEQYDHRLWKASISFASRPWFERQWILQEFILCPNTTLVCGDEVCDWSALQIWSRKTIQPSMQGVKDPVQYQRLLGNHAKVNTIIRQRQMTQDRAFSAAYPLDDLLRGMTLRGAKATREHDLIYGLLGLVTPKLREEIVVDYDVASTQLFMDVIKMALFSGQPSRQAALMWEFHEWRNNMGVQLTDHVCSWCPRLQNTQYEGRNDMTFNPALGQASLHLTGGVATLARTLPGTDVSTVQLKVIVLDSVLVTANSPFDRDVPLDMMGCLSAVMNPRIADWLEVILDLSAQANGASQTQTFFLEEFLRDTNLSRLDTESKLLLYQQLQRLTRSLPADSQDQQALLHATKLAQDPNPEIGRNLIASVARLRSHSRVSFCSTQTGELACCSAAHVLPGDLLCLVPGASWLHVFRKIDSPRGMRIFERIGIAWCTKWSTDGASQWTAADLQTLEIR